MSPRTFLQKKPQKKEKNKIKNLIMLEVQGQENLPMKLVYIYSRIIFNELLLLLFYCQNGFWKIKELLFTTHSSAKREKVLLCYLVSH